MTNPSGEATIDSRRTIGAASLRVYLLILSMSLLYSGVVFPAFARAAKEGIGPVRDLLRDTLKRTVPLAVLVALGVAGLAPLLLKIVFGPQFAGSDAILRLLCIAALFNFVAVVIGTALLAAGQFRDVMHNTLLATLILVVARPPSPPASGLRARRSRPRWPRDP